MKNTQVARVGQKWSWRNNELRTVTSTAPRFAYFDNHTSMVLDEHGVPTCDDWVFRERAPDGASQSTGDWNAVMSVDDYRLQSMDLEKYRASCDAPADDRVVRVGQYWRRALPYAGYKRIDNINCTYAISCCFAMELDSDGFPKVPSDWERLIVRVGQSWAHRRLSTHSWPARISSIDHDSCLATFDNGHVTSLEHKIPYMSVFRFIDEPSAEYTSLPDGTPGPCMEQVEPKSASETSREGVGATRPWKSAIEMVEGRFSARVARALFDSTNDGLYCGTFAADRYEDPWRTRARKSEALLKKTHYKTGNYEEI